MESWQRREVYHRKVSSHPWGSISSVVKGGVLQGSPPPRVTTGTAYQYLSTKPRVSAQWVGAALRPPHAGCPSPDSSTDHCMTSGKSPPSLSLGLPVWNPSSQACTDEPSAYKSEWGVETEGRTMEWNRDFYKKNWKIVNSLPWAGYCVGHGQIFSHWILSCSPSWCRSNHPHLKDEERDTERPRKLQRVTQQERQSPGAQLQCSVSSWPPPHPTPWLSTGAARSHSSSF